MLEYIQSHVVLVVSLLAGAAAPLQADSRPLAAGGPELTAPEARGGHEVPERGQKGKGKKKKEGAGEEEGKKKEDGTPFDEVVKEMIDSSGARKPRQYTFLNRLGELPS